MKTVIENWRNTDKPKGLKTGSNLRVWLRKQNTTFLI